MQRVINRYKLIYIAICAFIGFIIISALCCSYSIATEGNTSKTEDTNNTKITLYSKVTNVNSKISNTFRYEIVPHKDNIAGVKNEPKNIEVNFSDVAPNREKAAVKEVTIDFSEVIYPKPGIYRYDIYEIDSSNKTNFPMSSQKYEIYVMALNDNGKIKIEVLNQPTDLKDEVKTNNLEFTHQMVVPEPTEPASGGPAQSGGGAIQNNPQTNNLRRRKLSNILPYTGVFINVMPFVLILAVSLILIIYFMMKEKKIKKYENSSKDNKFFK